MRKPVLLMFGLSLIAIVKVHCNEHIGPIVNRMNDLNEEMAQVKRDLFRVEDKITNQINFAKISLRMELMQDMKQNVRQAIDEVLQGESVHEIVRSQVVSEVRQLKRGHLLMKRQLHHVQNSLRDIQKERDEYKEALEKVEKHSREFKCVIYPGETGTETKVSNNFTHSHLHLDQSVSHLSSELQSIKMKQDSLNISVSETRKDLVSARSEIKIVQASVNATGEDVSSTKAELTLLQALLKAAEQNILSTKSEITAVNTSLSAMRQEKMVTTSRFSAMQKRIVQLEKEKVMNTSDPSVAFEVTQTNHPLTLLRHQIVRFDTVVLNNGSGYDADTGKFEAPVSGTYLFWANILSIGGNLHVFLYKESSQVFVAYSPSDLIQCSLTYLVEVNRGENVWFRTADYTNGIHGKSHSVYGGVLIHAR